MAKKPINRIVIAGAGLGVLLAVIIPVLIFVVGVGNDKILPQANPDEFEIPFITPEDQEENKDKLEEIIDIIENPEDHIEIDPVLLKQNEDCNILIKSASEPNSLDTITDEELQKCQEISDLIGNQTQQQIKELLEDKEEEIILPPEVDIPTNSSINDPFTQLCDQNPSLIICTKTSSLELITKVLKQDSKGNQTTVETTTKIPQLALFAEETTNIDYKNGKLQFELFIKGDPEFNYMGTGKVDLLIGTQSLFVEPLSVKIEGVADSDGKVKIQFVSPTGELSDLILFDFANNFAKFTNEATTPIRLHVVELNISGEREQKFSLVDHDAFTMDITRDDIRLLITDAQGISTRVYPSDSRIILTTIASKSEPFISYTTRVTTYDSLFLGNGRGCTQFTVTSDVSYPKPTTGGTTYPVPAPSVSGISVLDSEDQVLTSVSGGSGKVLDYAKLTRDENYTLKVISPSITSSDLVYGKSQETKSYTCQQSATVNSKIVSSTSGTMTACGLYTVATSVVYDSLKLGAITCNIPK